MDDAVLDGRVVGDVEVQVAQGPEGSPVPAVEGTRLLHIEGARHDLSLPARENHTEPVAPALPQELEDPAVEIAMAPRVVVHRRAVEPVEHGHEVFRDVVTGERLDDDPLGLQLAALAADLVAALA